MIIQHNTTALRAYNANRRTTSSIKKNLEKLSSGYRINRAADDAAGLGVSERIRAKITELDRCQDNAAEGINLAQTADAALQEVNDMLKRARSLCIQAANGTYSDQELASISDEINQLFAEIDRISAGSYHNSICLFRGEIEEEYIYEYDEQFDGLSDTDLQSWGQVDFIQDTDFDPAKTAVAATAVFTLGDSIDVNDPSTLEGRSIQIGSSTFYFTSGTSCPRGTTLIKISGTIEETLEKLKASPDVASVEVDRSTRTVKLTAALGDLSEKIQADGMEINSVAKEGDGETINGTLVNNPMGSNSIEQVDGLGSTNNQILQSNVFTASFSLGTGNLTQDNVDNLVQNTLHVYNTDITFTTGATSGNQVQISVGMTRQALGNAIAAELNKVSGYTAQWDAQTSKLNVTYTASSTSPSTSMYIHESVKTLDSESSKYGTPWTASALNITMTTKGSTMESGGSCTINLPSIQTNTPFAVYINGTTHLYYNSDNNKLTYGEFTSTTYSGYSGSLSRHDMKGKSADQIRAEIISYIKAYANGAYSGLTVSEAGNTLTFSSNTANQNVNLSLIHGQSVTVTPYKSGSSTTTEHVMSSSYSYFQQTCSIEFSLGCGSLDDAAREALAGKGFSIEPEYSFYSPRRVEFTNGGSGLDSSYTDIDLSSCNDFSDLAAKVQAALQGSGTVYAVEIDTTNPTDAKLKITWNRPVNDGLPKVIDGNDGITDGTPVQFEGGENTNHSQIALDFSDINEDNLDTLLGKGFRINCATCSGEYINVFFCWSNNGNIPLSFQKEDPETGLMRTIHNVPVELSKVTSGDKIVESIVSQVKPSLTHYTDLAVGEPPTVLIAMEKRVGDVVDANGKPYYGSVQSGVETNFSYSVTLKKTLDLPPDGSVALKNAAVNIYVGSDPSAQIIPIHLPYIDLTYLRLCPPERVDLTDASQSADDWLARVDRADLAISDARGTIGADYNRLEHAIQDLSNADIQLSDAYSTIRDTDVAELMMKQVKDQILLQAQQSMLSQANQTPQGVLQLLQ